MLPVTGSSLPVSARPALFPDLQFSLHSWPQFPFTGCRDGVRDRPTLQQKGSRKAHGFIVLLTKGLARPHPLVFHPEGRWDLEGGGGVQSLCYRPGQHPHPTALDGSKPAFPSRLEARLHPPQRIPSAGPGVGPVFRDSQLPASQAQPTSALPKTAGSRFIKREKSPFPFTSKEFNLS